MKKPTTALDRKAELLPRHRLKNKAQQSCLRARNKNVVPNVRSAARAPFPQESGDRFRNGAPHSRRQRAGLSAPETAIQRYADLYVFSPIAYTSFDRSGRIEEINFAASKLLGRTRDRLIRSPFIWFVLREDSHLFLQHLFRCRSSKRQVETELRLRNTNGDVIFAQLSSTATSSSWRDGTLLYQTAIVDLTERKRAEQELQLISRLPAENPAPVIRLMYGRINYANPTAQKLLRLFHLGVGDLAPAEIRRMAEARQRTTAEIIFGAKVYDVLIAPVPNEGYVNLYFNDITAHKRGEEQQVALYRFVERQHEARSLRDIYAAALDALIDTTDCNRASILLFDRNGVMRFVHWRGLSSKYRGAVEGHSPWKVESKNPQPVAVSDISSADIPAKLKRSVKAEGIAAAAFIPLVVDQKLIGKVMIYYDAPHAFSEAELSVAVNIGRQLAIGIQRHRIEEELRKSKLLLEQRVQKRTEALRAANRELYREIERRKGLEGEILEISDREQQRLGQELHDGLCQQLTAIGFMTRATATRVKDHRVVDVEDLDRIAQLINNSVADARNIARDLHKEEVDAASFIEALRGLTEREMWKTRCHLELQTEVHIEDDRTASQLYRILREALINAHKHAQASKVVVEVQRRKNTIVFSVTDNGVGFSRKAKAGRGLGFHIMQYRARSIGARLKLESPAKGGARVICYLPQATGAG
jgi:PAS domain S-box-containing protein